MVSTSVDVAKLGFTAAAYYYYASDASSIT
jgi:hypothetical protein